MLVFVGCNYEKVPFVGYRDAFREVSASEPRVHFQFADVRITNKVIMQKVREEILQCDVGLFDVTFRNPNVMMELGIAIGADKPWNILYNPRDDTRSMTGKIWFNRNNIQLPANLRGYEYLEYSNKEQLRNKIAEWTAQSLERVARETSKRWVNTADSLTALLAREPGLKINEIANRLGGEHVALVRLTLSELRKKRILRSDGRGPATRYFVSVKAKRDVVAKPQAAVPEPAKLHR